MTTSAVEKSANELRGYLSAARTGRKTGGSMKTKLQAACSVEGCGKSARGHGLCSAHYTRARRHGNPVTSRPLRTSAGEVQRFLVETVLTHEGDNCLIWPFGRSADGYGKLTVNGRSVRAHRHVCELVKGVAPSAEHQAAHSCGKGHLACVNPKHLRWDTQKGNFADKKLHGTQCQGETHGKSRFTEAEVREIRVLRRTLTLDELATRYRTGRSTIFNIVTRKTWAHIA
jgi:hypothetical protein